MTTMVTKVKLRHNSCFVGTVELSKVLKGGRVSVTVLGGRI